jgi:hypothetical protein
MQLLLSLLTRHSGETFTPALGARSLASPRGVCGSFHGLKKSVIVRNGFAALFGCVVELGV